MSRFITVGIHILFSIAFYNFNCGLVICPERVYTISDTNRKEICNCMQIESLNHSMAEYLDIVDENGIPTGETVEHETVHAKGFRHRTRA